MMFGTSTFSFEPTDSNLEILPKEETLNLREQFIPKVCALHFERSPLKVTRAYGQYLYDHEGVEYLDCINCVAHVGHCNPNVVNAGKNAMLTLGCVSMGLSDHAAMYISKLKTTLPAELDTFLFVTSGAEANDLALQLARLNTTGHDVIAVEGAFHGSLSETNFISSKHSANTEPYQAPPWVHIIPCPDLYRGAYSETDPASTNKYIADASKVIDKAVEDGRKIACFISEPIMSVSGLIVPPAGWLGEMYSKIRAIGGLTIADETQCGLGRTGTSWWGFQHLDAIPDIVTVGKPLGNGHPMALLITRSQIAEKLGSDSLQTFSCCDNVVAAIGTAVLNTVRSENMLKNAREVGTFLREGLRALAAEHPNIGHVRGVGLMIGVEIVHNRENRMPAREIAEMICYKLKEKHIIMGNEGIHKNILLIVPPMCFTLENAHQVVMNIGSILEDFHEEDKGIGPVEENVTEQSNLISLGVFDETSADAFFSLSSSGHDFSALD